MDAIIQLLKIDPAIFAKIIAIVLIINAVLSGLAATLHKVAEMTDNQGLDKADGIVQKIVFYAQKVVDFLSANVKH